eukprot:10443270-Alexandrium_andersonii.AAC.1
MVSSPGGALPASRALLACLRPSTFPLPQACSSTRHNRGPASLACSFAGGAGGAGGGVGGAGVCC